MASGTWQQMRLNSWKDARALHKETEEISIRESKCSYRGRTSPEEVNTCESASSSEQDESETSPAARWRLRPTA